MTKITKEEVKHVALLARIGINEADLEKYAHDMQSILKYVEVLQQVDTNDISPTYQVSGNCNVMQDDEIEKGLKREDILVLAKDKDLANFITKGVFDNE